MYEDEQQHQQQQRFSGDGNKERIPDRKGGSHGRWIWRGGNCGRHHGFSITQCPSVLRDVLLAEDEKSVCSPSNRTIDEYMIAEELSGKLLFPEQCGGGGGYFVLKALKAVPVDYTRKEVYSSLFGLY